MRRSTDQKAVSFHRVPALRTVVSMIHRSVQTPALLLVLMGAFFSAGAGAFGVAAWGSLGPEPEDYLTEYEAASLTALVGIQKLTITLGVIGLLFIASAAIITQLSDDSRNGDRDSSLG